MDDENTQAPEVAPQQGETQIEQAATTETVDTPPQPEDTGEKLYAGKYKSPEDMEKAYIEAQAKMTQLAQEKARLEASQIQQDLVQPVESNFDEDTVNFVKGVFAQEREREKVAEFVAKNADDLSDPVIRGAVKEIIAQARNSGQYIDQNEALAQAKQQIESRLFKKVTEAKANGEQEGREIANKKEQMSAVGTTAGKSEIDPTKLSSKEYAEYYGLQRAS